MSAQWQQIGNINSVQMNQTVMLSDVKQTQSVLVSEVSDAQLRVTDLELNDADIEVCTQSTYSNYIVILR